MAETAAPPVPGTPPVESPIVPPGQFPDPAEQAFHQEMTSQELEHRLGVQVVDMSTAVQANAADHAAEFINRKTTEGNFAQRLYRKVWHGNIARDYYVAHEQQRARSEITESGNIYAAQGKSQEEHDQAAGAVVNRFVNDFIHEGETQKSLAEVERGADLQDQLKSLVKTFAEGSLAEDALVEEKTRLLNEFGKSTHAEDRKKGLVYADNIVGIARNAKAAFNHGIGMERIDSALNVKHGEARMGVRTESKLTATERVVDKLYSTKLGSLANETTLVTATSIALAAAKFTTRKAWVAAARMGTLGLGSAVIAGVREKFHIKQDRRTHSREMAEGAEHSILHSGKRRQSLEATRYTTVAAQELTANLGESLVKMRETPEGLKSAVDMIAQAEARTRLSDRESIDLIHFSGKTSVEQERLDLDMRLAEARVAVKHALADADEATLGAAGISPDSRDISTLIESRVTAIIDGVRASEGVDAVEGLRDDIAARDRVFSKLQRNRVLGAAALGFVSGEVIGLGLQEARAAISDQLQGVFEHQDANDHRRTLLAALAHHGVAHTTTHNVVQETPGGPSSVYVSDTAQVNVPAGYHLIEQGDKWELVSSSNNQVVDGDVTFDPNGNFSETTRQLLTEKGFHFSDQANIINDPDTITTTQVTSTPTDYVNAHPDQFTAVNRELWYDNNTPGIYDKNELRLDWGGQGGIDANGDYVFSIQDMTANGSYHGGLSANAQELLKQGKMAMALSLTKDTQGHVSLIHFNAQGIAVIPKGSFDAQTMFASQNGHAEFTGAYAEAVQLGDVKNGVQSMSMLATVVGSNHPDTSKITDTVTDVVHHEHTQITTTLTAPEVPAEVVRPLSEIPIEIPLVVPIRGRTGLDYRNANGERPGTPENDVANPRFENPFYYYSGAELSTLQRWIRDDPSRLRPRQEVTEEDGSKRWVESDGSPVERNVERERAAIASYLEKQQRDNPEHFSIIEKMADSMAPMEDDCRVAINVPAWLEARNLNHFLQQFTGQANDRGEAVDPNLYEINVLVNRKTGTEPDNSTAVIEEFINNFEATFGASPKINYYDVEISPPNNNVGYARKLLTDSTMLRSQRRQVQANPLYIESEDADISRADPKTVFNLIQKLDKNPQLDAVRGVADRDPEYLMQNDLLFVQRRIWDFAETLARRREFRDPTRPGWNSMWNRNWLNGWNSGFSAEAYALIGGYDPIKVGEDMRLGEKMAMIRGNGTLPNLEVVGKVRTRSDGDPRRFIAEIRRGRAAYSDGEFENEALNKELREKSTDELMATISQYDRIRPENVASFNALVNNYSKKFVGTVTSTQSEATEMTKRLLFWLGFHKDDYELNGQDVTVKTWINVEEALDNYRARHSLIPMRTP